MELQLQPRVEKPLGVCRWRIIIVALEQEDWAQSGHSGGDFGFSLFQIGITMLVSVEDLEEAGESVSFQLQIRRY